MRHGSAKWGSGRPVAGGGEGGARARGPGTPSRLFPSPNSVPSHLRMRVHPHTHAGYGLSKSLGLSDRIARTNSIEVRGPHLHYPFNVPIPLSSLTSSFRIGCLVLGFRVASPQFSRSPFFQDIKDRRYRHALPPRSRSPPEQKLLKLKFVSDYHNLLCVPKSMPCVATCKPATCKPGTAPATDLVRPRGENFQVFEVDLKSESDYRRL